MTNTYIKRCSKCSLPETYPGIKFNDEHICNYCIYQEIYKEREMAIKKILKKEFIKVIAQNKKRKNRYDCIVAYSGGKDSTFLLYYLKKRFHLNILAHTLDNRFMSEKTFDNIRNVVRKLHVDHIYTRPPISLCRQIFTDALKDKFSYPKEIRAMLSPICATCLGMVFGTTINLAIHNKIPIMFIGFTPGQYPAVSLENFLKNDSCIYLSDRVYKDDPVDIIKIISDPVKEKYGSQVKKYYFKSQYITKGAFVPKVLLPYHAMLAYNEDKIYNEINKLGWIKPDDTDPCSTNCLLNTVGNIAASGQSKYHPYCGELSYLIRENNIKRRDAIDAENTELGSYAAQYSLKRLGMKEKDLIFKS